MSGGPTLGDAFVIQLTRELHELNGPLRRLKLMSANVSPPSRASYELKVNRLHRKVLEKQKLITMIASANVLNVDRLRSVLADILQLLDQLEARPDFGRGVLSGQTMKAVKQRQELKQLTAQLSTPFEQHVLSGPASGAPPGDPAIAIALGLSIIFDIIKGRLGLKDQKP